MVPPRRERAAGRRAPGPQHLTPATVARALPAETWSEPQPCRTRSHSVARWGRGRPWVTSVAIRRMWGGLAPHAGGGCQAAPRQRAADPRPAPWPPLLFTRCQPGFCHGPGAARTFSRGPQAAFRPSLSPSPLVAPSFTPSGPSTPTHWVPPSCLARLVPEHCTPSVRGTISPTEM